MKKLLMDLGERSYDIVFSKSFNELLENLKNINCPDKILIVTDSNVHKLYLDEVRKILSDGGYDVGVCVFDAGEENKNMNTILKILEKCMEHKMDRKSMMIALGGGVVGDMAGFAASIFMRGIDFVQIPTTLLSQTDSSVGGKTGIDFLKAKNILGAFHQPRLVYINSSVLKTLPRREIISGMGEVIKHAVIRDYDFFEYLKKNMDNVRELSSDIMLEIIYKNCSIKASVVSQDEKEMGVRADLNFGHTFGHAVESYLDFKLTHGESVALGMIAAFRVALMRGLVSKEYFDELIKILMEYGFSIKTHISDIDEVIALMHKDKKKSSKKLKFILPSGRGNVIQCDDLTDEEIISAFKFISK